MFTFLSLGYKDSTKRKVELIIAIFLILNGVFWLMHSYRIAKKIDKILKGEMEMNEMFYYIGIFIELFFLIGFFVCKFVISSNFYGVSPSDFLAIAILLNLILTVWRMINDKNAKSAK